LWLDEQVLVRHGRLPQIHDIRYVWNVGLEVVHEVVGLIQDID